MDVLLRLSGVGVGIGEQGRVPSKSERHGSGRMRKGSRKGMPLWLTILSLSQLYHISLKIWIKLFVLAHRGCRLEIITDQDPCKSDFDFDFEKVLMQIIFISLQNKEYQIIFAT